VADYVRAAVETAVQIHEEDLPGDILIFLTGTHRLAPPSGLNVFVGSHRTWHGVAGQFVPIDRVITCIPEACTWLIAM